MSTTAGTTSDIAVVIPAHRCATTLDAALASVAAQSLRPAHVVVGDDASGDDTPDVARRWADRLPVDVVTLPENQGPAGARRAAIGATSTRRVALLDADDVWFPDHLETLARVHDAHRGLVTADVLRWIPGVGVATRSLEAMLPVPSPEAQRSAIHRANFVFVGSLFDRSLHDEVGGFRPPFRGPEDWDLWMRMVRAGAVVRRADHPTVLYRLSPGSVSADVRLVEQERLVVEQAMTETADRDDRAALVAAARDIEAKAALFTGYDEGRAGRRWAARRAAVRGLRGPVPVAVRCLGLLVAPVAGTRARDRRVHQPRYWLRA